MGEQVAKKPKATAGMITGHNFKALSCTPTYLSPQFLHLSIGIFLTFLSASIINKFEVNNKFHEFIRRNGEIGTFEYAGVQDRVLKLGHE